MGAPARTPVIIGAVTILVLALLSLLAPSTATYDPWAWIIWGREVVHGDLNTISGPSWKPLPVVVTSIAALFGDIAPGIWVVVARAGALAGVAAAFLLGRRIAGATGGVLAAAPLLLAPWFFKHGWFANSEGLLVMFVLGAVLAELDRRRGVAMACWIAAGLLRPEAWPFLLLYAAWVAWRSDARGRIAVLAALCILPPAWLLPEKWGSGDYWRASTRAQNPDPGSASLTAHPWWTIVRNFWDMLPTVTWVAVAAAVVVGGGLAVARRGRATPATGAAAVDPVDGETASTGPSPNGAGAPAIGSAPVAAATSPRTIGPWAVVAGLAILGLAWLALVAVMTERGYSGNERYLIQPAALLIVAAAGAVGLVLRSLPRPAHVALAALAFAGIAVTAIQQMPGQVRREVYEGRLVDDLNRAIDRAGGPDRLKACGPVGTLNIMVPQVAWALGEHAVDIQNATGPGPRVVLRLKIRKDAPLSPAVTRVPRMPELARTPYWQIEAADCAAAGGPSR